MGSPTVGVSSPRAGLLFGVVVFLVVFAAQIALYHESFRVQPAGDDFSPPLAEIARGEREGPAAFFLETKQTGRYRPLQSTAMWLFGRISEEHRPVWISVLHFLCMGVYGLACLLWTRQLGLGRLGVLMAAVATFAHPAFAGPLGGIDTFAGILTHAIMWLGALAALVWRERFPVAVIAALACLVVGSLFKEYAFGLVPLAALTVLVFSPRKPWGRAFVMGAVLLAFMVGSLAARRVAGLDPEGLTPIEYSFGYMVSTVMRNAVLLAAGTVFTGNTIWVYVDRSSLAIGWAVVNIASLIAVVSIGVGMLLRREVVAETAGDPAPARPGGFTSRRWVVFLVLSFAAASFPANLIPYQVSEIYVTGLMLPLALLCGLAAEGFARGPAWARSAAAALAAAHLVVACLAITAKVHALRTAGEMASRLLDQLTALVPDDARDQTVGIVYVLPELESEPHYSVFLMRADIAVGCEWTLDYGLPDRGLWNESVYVNSLDEVDRSAYEIILRWDQQAGRFERMQ